MVVLQSLVPAAWVLGLVLEAVPCFAVDTPWPPVPPQEDYTVSDVPIHVQPISVIKGLSNQTDKPLSGNDVLNFTKVGDTFTLDYGVASAGKPFFNIVSIDGYAQIEVKFTEAYNGLLSPQADGPFAFSNALAATFRVETFNLTQTGNFTGYFIQGSQRWQSIKLVKGSGLVLSSPALLSSVDTSPISSQMGYFASSNSTYTDIWALALRTEQHTCLLPGTQTSTWTISDQGAYIRGQKPATSAKVTNLSNYTLAFDTMIDYGGTGWRVDTEIDAIQATGPILVLTSEYLEGSFANTDQSLLPPNTLVLGRGWSLQNQTSLPGYILDKFPLETAVTEKAWHTIKTVSHGDNTYTIYLDEQQIAHFNISSYGIGDPNPYIPGGTKKGFAFGPWQDQAAYVRNVVVIDSAGQVVYNNTMTSTDVLIEYGVQTNAAILGSDSGKRDRYSWMGDRLVSARTTMIATGKDECVWGPTEQAFNRQVTSGQVPINTLISPLDIEGILVRTTNVDPLLVDYSFDFLSTIYNYWFSSGNDTFIQQHWTQMVAVMSYAISESLDPTTQLYGKSSGSFGLPIGAQKGKSLGPAPTVSMIKGLENMAQMAIYLGYDPLASLYQSQAQLSRNAIESLLWNSTDGYYAATLGSTDIEIMDIAQILIAGIGSYEQRDQYLEKLRSLKVPAGYLNGTAYFDTPGIVNPYHMSFLLEGLAKEGHTVLAQELLDNTYSPMVRRDVNYTGGYWEYVSVDGTYPGLDLFTGLSHYWGSYATVFLTEYALGIRASMLAYTEFVFAPLIGFQTEWMQGRIPTPRGPIVAAWGYDSAGKIVMEVTAPAGTVGMIIPPFSGTWSTTNLTAQMGNITFQGTYRLTQD